MASIWMGVFLMGTSATTSPKSSYSIVKSTQSFLAANQKQSRRRSREPALEGEGKLGRISWRVVALTRINRLRAMLSMIEGGPYQDNEAIKQAEQLLHSSQDVLEQWKETLRTWWTGALRDLVWRQIHMAETYIVSMLPDSERRHRTTEMLFDAKGILDRDDPVMNVDPADPSTFAIRKLSHVNGKPSHVSASRSDHKEETAKRVFAYELVRRYREAWDDRYTASRGFRNRLIVLITIVTLAVVILIISGSLGLVWLDVSSTPPHAVLAPQLSHLLAMLTIAFLGAIGGLISGSGEVVKVGGVYNPFSLPWYLLFFKIPMGALTGILGVLAIKGNLLPDMKLTMNNWSQIIIWALVFGASQQLITFMVDRRVKALSTNTPQEQVVNK